jgi:streptogramin lyase
VGRWGRVGWLTVSLTVLLGVDPPLAGAGVGSVVEYPSVDSGEWVASGPGGELWFTGASGAFLEKVSVAGGVVPVLLPADVVATGHLAVDAQGDIWVEEELDGGEWVLAEFSSAGAALRSAPVLGPGWVTAGADHSLLWVSEGNDDVAEVQVATGAVQQLAVTAGSTTGVATTADGTAYVAEAKVDRVGVVLPSGGPPVLASYQLPEGADPQGVTVAPDGSVWVAEPGINSLAKIVPGTHAYDAYVVQVPLPSGARPDQPVVGADGNLWVSEAGMETLARVSVHGVVTQFPLVGSHAQGVAEGFDDKVWFAYSQGIGNVDPGVTPEVITTVAGGGDSLLYPAGQIPDQVPAIQASIGPPASIAVDGQGDIYFADTRNNEVREVTPAGGMSIVAGGGGNDYPNHGDGGPATDAELRFPDAVALDGSGDLFIADTGHAEVREVSTSGIITTIAGNGQSGSSGDGGPAVRAKLEAPDGLAVDSAGDVYVSDRVTNRIRKISPSGIITTVAGTGTAGFSGDGDPATNAELNGPAGLAFGPDGTLYVADQNNQRIRAISPTGIITTVAGDGQPGFSGDGGPATDASLDDPQDIVVNQAGDLYIADTLNGLVREVTPNGVITTVAGGGNYQYLGEGGSATQAGLAQVPSVSLDQDGNLLIGTSNDLSNYDSLIRTITPPA